MDLCSPDPQPRPRGRARGACPALERLEGDSDPVLQAHRPEWRFRVGKTELAALDLLARVHNIDRANGYGSTVRMAIHTIERVATGVLEGTPLRWVQGTTGAPGTLELQPMRAEDPALERAEDHETMLRVAAGINDRKALGHLELWAAYADGRRPSLAALLRRTIRRAAELESARLAGWRLTL